MKLSNFIAMKLSNFIVTFFFALVVKNLENALHSNTMVILFFTNVITSLLSYLSIHFLILSFFFLFSFRDHYFDRGYVEVIFSV